MKIYLSLMVSVVMLTGCTIPEEKELQDIHQQVIKDAIAQYENIKKTDDKIEICVYAGMVTAAYTQANNKTEADKWKIIEDQDCKKAGIPMV